MNPTPTICWECKHADKGKDSVCPWASEFKPVEGCYNNYILKNSYLWKNNVPDDIYEELEVLK